MHLNCVQGVQIIKKTGRKLKLSDQEGIVLFVEKYLLYFFVYRRRINMAQPFIKSISRFFFGAAVFGESINN